MAEKGVRIGNGGVRCLCDTYVVVVAVVEGGDMMVLGYVEAGTG